MATGREITWPPTGRSRCPLTDPTAPYQWKFGSMRVGDRRFENGLCAPGEVVWHDLREPKRMRYQLLHVAIDVPRSARRVTVKLGADWPWTP